MWKIWKRKEKKTKKNFDLPEQGFEPQIFSNFPGHDLNFHGAQIKSKQASKRDRTVTKHEKFYLLPLVYEQAIDVLFSAEALSNNGSNSIFFLLIECNISWSKMTFQLNCKQKIRCSSSLQCHDCRNGSSNLNQNKQNELHSVLVS